MQNHLKDEARPRFIQTFVLPRFARGPSTGFAVEWLHGTLVTFMVVIMGSDDVTLVAA